MSIRFRLSPELADGEHYTVADTPEQLCEAIRAWCEDPEVGEGFSVEVVDISQKDVDSWPEI